MPQPHGDNPGDNLSTDELAENSPEHRVEGFPAMQKTRHHELREKRRKRFTLQQVIVVRQQKIYEQQCEIEELRRRIRELGNDNKFLREQNYWQAKALEKLDGRQAELPQLINGHLEEIRVFREQIRRMKDVLKIEKQRRHDAEAANEKALFELRHLRKLAEKQNLLEREELMQTIEKLRVEAAERGKLLKNLERYAENLEKNQRFESLRSSKAQKDMKDTCQRLLDRIHELEQTVQEKQKIIELGNIYSKRLIKQQTITLNTSAEVGHSSTESVHNGAMEVECDASKGKLRERIREFDQRRQDMERKRERIRRKRLQHSNLENLDDEDCYEVALENVEADKSDTEGNQLLTISPTQTDSRCNAGSSEPDQNGRFRSADQNSVVLPKILPKDSPSKPDGKRNRATYDAKQVKFSEITPCTGRTRDEEVIFKQLQSNERLARLFAEASLERNHVELDAQRDKLEYADDFVVDYDLTARMKAIERFSKPSLMNVQVKVKPAGSNQISSSSVFADSPKDNVEMSQSPKAVTVEDASCKQEPPEYLTKNVQSSTKETAHSVEPHSPSCKFPATASSPKESQLSRDFSAFDSFKLVPLPEATKQICRPCGEQDLDSFTTEETSNTGSPTNSDTMATGGDDEYTWQESPSVKGGSSLNSSRLPSRVYHGPNGLLVNASNDIEGLDIEYITEAVFGPIRVTATGTSAGSSSKNNTILLTSPGRTKTLYKMMKNDTDHPGE
ncbi:Lebercilin [Clonorchis sinensis]|uniref:Lebercilin n=1 Tax=Clonorchis sinensis TaxID=79923 RepID=A0A8T1MAA2_CLOSI|nr:Lebercilin [Clonorchis sinensis]